MLQDFLPEECVRKGVRKWKAIGMELMEFERRVDILLHQVDFTYILSLDSQLITNVFSNVT